MSQNRQESKDRARSEHDYQVNLKAELEIRQLHEKMDHLLVPATNFRAPLRAIGSPAPGSGTERGTKPSVKLVYRKPAFKLLVAGITGSASLQLADAGARPGRRRREPDDLLQHCLQLPFQSGRRSSHVLACTTGTPGLMHRRTREHCAAPA